MKCLQLNAATQLRRKIHFYCVNTRHFSAMNSLLFIVLFSVCIRSSSPLIQTLLTHTYSEWIMRSEVSTTCGWECTCPSQLQNNVCQCKHRESDSAFAIESPYAALMIQTDCPALNPNQGTSDDTIEIDFNIGTSTPIIIYHRGKSSNQRSLFCKDSI